MKDSQTLSGLRLVYFADDYFFLAAPNEFGAMGTWS